MIRFKWGFFYLYNKMANVDNYESFISMDLSKYAGKWVVIDKGKVIADDPDFEKVFQRAKELAPTNKRPFITKIRGNNFL